MHVGFAPLFQNLGQPVPDHEVYAREMAMADQAEGMGFDSVWSVGTTLPTTPWCRMWCSS